MSRRRALPLAALIITALLAVPALSAPAASSPGGPAAVPGVPFDPPQHVTTVSGAATICQSGERDVVHRDHLPINFVRNAYWHGRGRMCLHSDGRPDFRVTSMPSRDPHGRVLGFPDIGRGCHWGHCTNSQYPVRVDRIRQLISTVHSPGSPAGTYNKAYDLWFNRTPATYQVAHYDGTELMIWNGQHGNCCWSPLHHTLVRIDGVLYRRYHTVVYDHSDGKYYGGARFHWNYIQYRRVHPSDHVHVDLRHFIRDAERQHVIRPTWWLETVEYGFEIWKGGVGLRAERFTVGLRAAAPAKRRPANAISR